MRRREPPRCGERGMALLVAVVTTALLAALGTALLLVTSTETMIAANVRDGARAFYAAEGAVERVMPELLVADDWDAVLGGQVISTLVDGPPGGVRELAGGARLDLTSATTMLRCGHPSACSPAGMDAVTEERPWGANNPRWHLYAWGWMDDLFEVAASGSRMYLVVWVGDDPFERDGDPLRDDPDPSSPGHEKLAVRAHAYGPDGTRRAVEATVHRRDGAIRLVSWREVR